MKPPCHFDSWGALAALPADVIPAGVTLLSVDVFDTLLLRKVDPGLLVAATGRELERRLRALGIAVVEPAAAARYAVFTELGATNAAAGRDFAATLREVLPGWLDRVAGGTVWPPELAFELEEYELSLERRFSYPNSALAGWLRARRAEGRRLVFCSDMYLAGQSLAGLLAHHGLGDLFDHGFCSADHGVLKKTGRLFPELCRDQGVAPEEVLHIGDCPDADGEKAAAAGLHSFVVRDRGEARRRRALARDERRLAAEPGWTAPLAGELAERADLLLGPVCAAFVHALAERCRELGLRRVYFLSREGLVLGEIFELLRPLVWPDGGGPAASYLGVSRLPTLLAGSRFYGLRQLAAALANHRFPTLRRLLAPLEVGEELMQNLARRHGIAEVDAPLPAGFRDWPPFQRLLEDGELLAHLTENQARHHELLRSYLEQEGFFAGGSVALVDVGWSGQIQDNLCQACGDEPGFPRVYGLYLGVKNAARWNGRENSFLEGLLADESRPDWHGNAAFLFVQAIEALLRAPHGTVVGYERRGGRIEPRLRPESEPARQREAAEEKLLAEVQEGILRYAKSYAALAELSGARAADALPWARTCLDRWLRFPRAEEARFLFSLSTVCDLGMDEVVQLGENGGRFWKLPALLPRSLWKQGTWTLLTGRIVRHAGILWHAFRAARPAAQEGDWRLGPGLRRGDDRGISISSYIAAGGEISEFSEASRSGTMEEDTQIPQPSPRAARRARPGPSPQSGSPFATMALTRQQELLQTEGAQPPPTRPPGIGYFLASTLDRALVNLMCRLRGKRPYPATGFPALAWLRRRLRP